MDSPIRLIPMLPDTSNRMDLSGQSGTIIMHSWAMARPSTRTSPSKLRHPGFARFPVAITSVLSCWRPDNSRDLAVEPLADWGMASPWRMIGPRWIFRAASGISISAATSQARSGRKARSGRPGGTFMGPSGTVLRLAEQLGHPFPRRTPREWLQVIITACIWRPTVRSGAWDEILPANWGLGIAWIEMRR